MLWGSKNINLTFTELYKCTWISRHWKWILNSIAKLEGYFGHIFCVCVLHTSAQCTTNSNKLQTYGNILYFSYLILQFVNVFSPSFFTKRMLFTLSLSKIGAKEKKSIVQYGEELVFSIKLSEPFCMNVTRVAWVDW